MLVSPLDQTLSLLCPPKSNILFRRATSEFQRNHLKPLYTETNGGHSRSYPLLCFEEAVRMISVRSSAVPRGIARSAKMLEMVRPRVAASARRRCRSCFRLEYHAADRNDRLPRWQIVAISPVEGWLKA